MSKFSQIFETTEGRLSSKRVCGVLGWIIILIGFLVILFITKQAPPFTEFLIGAVVTLLGVDSVTGVFKKKSNTEENGENQS